MVSKFVTDENLEANDQPFESTYVTSGDTTDVYTFRPQLAGIEAGQAVDFRVQVFRAGAPAGYDETFASVEGTLEDGTPAYRGERFLRLVSNAEPPNAPSGTTYDDEYAGRQTILVQLGDRLRLTPQVNGTAQDSLELPVGGAPESDSDNAMRRARLNWQTLEGKNSAPATITRRMSEDWAQAGIFFEKVGESTFQKPLQNALSIEFPRGKVLGIVRIGPRGNAASSNGTLQTDVSVNGGSPQQVTASYSKGDPAIVVAGKLKQAIVSSISGVGNEDVYTSVAEPPRETDPQKQSKAFIFTSPSVKIQFNNKQGDSGLNFQDADLSYQSFRSEVELNVVGASVRDDDDQTIDVVVLPSASLPTAPGSISYGQAGFDNKPEVGLKNLIFLVEEAADEDDNYSTVAGHEAGHVLFNKEFLGSNPDNTGHSTVSTNLMYAPSPNDPQAQKRYRRKLKTEELDSPKRLTAAQQKDARDDSGPGSSGPVLLEPAAPPAGNGASMQQVVARSERE